MPFMNAATRTTRWLDIERGILGEHEHAREHHVVNAGQQDHQHHRGEALVLAEHPRGQDRHAGDQQQRNRRRAERAIGYEHVDQQSANECGDDAVFDPEHDRGDDGNDQDEISRSAGDRDLRQHGCLEESRD